MRKSDGAFTYFVPDIAYHVTKWKRGFRRAITELGADHAGSLLARARRTAGAGNGGPRGLSRLCPAPDGAGDAQRRGSEAIQARRHRRDAARTHRRSRSRRRALFLSPAQVGLAARLSTSTSRARKARRILSTTCSMRTRACAACWKRQGSTSRRAASTLRTSSWRRCASPYEDALLRRLADFPDELAIALRELAPHRITFFLKELAAEFHSYYNAEQFLVDDPVVRSARLALVVATGQVIRNGLAILGVSAPEKM